MTKFKEQYGNKAKLITGFDAKKAFVGKTHIHYFVGKINISNEPKPLGMHNLEIEKQLRSARWEILFFLPKNHKIRKLLK